MTLQEYLPPDGNPMRTWSDARVYFVVSKIMIAGHWLSMPDAIIDALQELGNEFPDSSVVDIAIGFSQSINFRLEEFEYVNSLKDILVIKELLKQEYFRDDIDFSSKSTLLYSLTEFIEIDDESFYNQSWKSALSYQNIYHAIVLIQGIIKALEYIKLLKREYDNHLKIIRNKDNVIKKIMYRQHNIMDTSCYKKLSIYKSINYLKNNENLTCFDEYFVSNNTTFMNFSGKMVDHKITFSFDKNYIKLSINLENKLIIEETKYDIVKFIESIYGLYEIYHEVDISDESNAFGKYSIFSFDDSLSMNFFIKKSKGGDVSLSIGNQRSIDKRKKYEAIEFIKLFKYIIQFMTIKYSLDYGECILKMTSLKHLEVLNIAKP